MMSMDIRKAFDSDEHSALFNVLYLHGIPDVYITILRLLYRGQTGSTNGSKYVDITRDVKQGDVLSAILFNCVMDIVFERWKKKLSHEGLLIAPGLARLTNTRYADDILLYAKPLDELQRMTELLMIELEVVGLSMNAKKTKILHTPLEDELHDCDFADIEGEIVEIIQDDSWHRYLGRYFSLSPYKRKRVWDALHKHKNVILNKHVSLHKRHKYFDTCVSPTILFGISTLPLSSSRLKSLDILQRKMMRRIVGWRRSEDESWREIMERMNRRLQYKHELHYYEPWSISYARAQWRYVHHVIEAYLLLTARKFTKYILNTKPDPHCRYHPHRSQGRSHLRWDDRLQSFCCHQWPHLRGQHWFEILNTMDRRKYEDEYVLYIFSKSE